MDEDVITVDDFTSSEDRCLECLHKIRWRERVICPICGSDEVVKHGRENGKQRYMCHGHHGTFRDTTGTVFESTKLPLRYWFYHISRNSQNLSAKRLMEIFGVSYVTAHRMKKIAQKIKEDDDRINLDGLIAEFNGMYGNSGSKGGKAANRKPRENQIKEHER